MINLFRPLFLVSSRPPRVRLLTFLFYSLNLLHKVTHIFWTLACIVALSPHTALVLSFCTSSQDFIPHFLHFHLTMDSLCFLNGWLICTSIVDFHHLVRCHAWHTIKNRRLFKPPIFLYLFAPDSSGFLNQKLVGRKSL